VLKCLATLFIAIAGAVSAYPALASAETTGPPIIKQSVAQATPTPSPGPLTFRGYYRGYYFTRQNASNNPCCQFNFSPGAKYNSNAVNQATFNQGVQLHADYHFQDSAFYIGGGYFYANPMDGPCVVPANHLKGAVCVSQAPPNTNADDTLPGFTISTFDEAYLGYAGYGVAAKIGSQIINTPWANPDLSRLKADAFQGADFAYTLPSGLNFDAMDMIAFEARGASTFSQQTLLTGYPAGGGGLPANIIAPGGRGITTPGFFMFKTGYVAPPAAGTNPYQVDGYLYNVQNIVNMYWGDGKYTFGSVPLKPWVEMQGGWESNTGSSVIGKIQSSLVGLRLGVNVTKNVVFTAALDTLPWHDDQIYLPKGVTCNNSDYQITATSTLAYFLPLNAGQCFTNSSSGRTSIYYGGWASPYTDNWATDPIFTTQMIQGMADRRSPGTSYKIAATFTSNNKRLIFLASDAWYNYGNALAPETTNEWDLDGTYRFSKAPPTGGYYRGLVLRQRIGVRTLSNTYCGDAATSCLAGSTLGAEYLGGLPIFKYSRSQLEYDF
jgi:hypothetical protein